MKWNYWKQECQNRCSHGDLASYPQLLRIAQVKKKFNIDRLLFIFM